jgi:hypothetical protein
MFWPRTNYRRDVSSGVVLFVWCLAFELVDGYLCFVLVLTCGVYCIIILYIIHILLLYLILYYYYILYYILYYTILFFSSIPLFPSHTDTFLFSSISSIPILFLLFLSFYPSFPDNPSLPNPSSSPIFPIFILYLSVLTYAYLCSNPNQNNLTPHVLSEWMVEVCGAYLYLVV